MAKRRLKNISYPIFIGLLSKKKSFIHQMSIFQPWTFFKNGKNGLKWKRFVPLLASMSCDYQPISFTIQLMAHEKAANQHVVLSKAVLCFLKLMLGVQRVVIIQTINCIVQAHVILIRSLVGTKQLQLNKLKTINLHKIDRKWNDWQNEGNPFEAASVQRYLN